MSAVPSSDLFNNIFLNNNFMYEEELGFFGREFYLNPIMIYLEFYFCCDELKNHLARRNDVYFSCGIFGLEFIWSF